MMDGPPPAKRQRPNKSCTLCREKKTKVSINDDEPVTNGRTIKINVFPV